MALGGKLVEQFELRQDEDTLGQWIAHHLAEKLVAHEKASGTARAELEVELVGTILKFWKHRAYFPRGTKPFEGYEAVLRALESFDPKPDHGRYFFYDGADKLAKGTTPPAQEWLDAAKTFDRGARAIVSFCIRQAARASEQPDEVWLSAAKVLAEDADRDFIAIKILRAGEKEEETTDPLADQKKQLEAKRDDLRRLIGGGVPILRLIENQLEGLGEQAVSSEKRKGKSKAVSKANTTTEHKPKRKVNKSSISKSSKKKRPSRKTARRR